MLTNMLESSLMAYDVLDDSTQKERIAAIINACEGDITGAEIRAEYERLYKRIDIGTVSARVNKLLHEGAIQRLPQLRKCTIGHNPRSVYPVCRMADQKGMLL